jgi:hypothetical protein
LERTTAIVRGLSDNTRRFHNPALGSPEGAAAYRDLVAHHTILLGEFQAGGGVWRRIGEGVARNGRQEDRSDDIRDDPGARCS